MKVAETGQESQIHLGDLVWGRWWTLRAELSHSAIKFARRQPPSAILQNAFFQDGSSDGAVQRRDLLQDAKGVIIGATTEGDHFKDPPPLELVGHTPEE